MGKLLLLFLFIGIIGCAGMNVTGGELELIGKWKVESIAGSPVIDRNPAYIQFTEDGRVSGNSSCNQFSGGYEQTGVQLSFGQMATTRKMCPGALMDQETRFLKSLAKVTRAEIKNELLLLLDAEGNTLFKTSR